MLRRGLLCAPPLPTRFEHGVASVVRNANNYGRVYFLVVRNANNYGRVTMLCMRVGGWILRRGRRYEIVDFGSTAERTNL